MIIRDSDLYRNLLFDSYGMAFIIMGQDGYWSPSHHLQFSSSRMQEKREKAVCSILMRKPLEVPHNAYTLNGQNLACLVTCHILVQGRLGKSLLSGCHYVPLKAKIMLISMEKENA